MIPSPLYGWIERKASLPRRFQGCDSKDATAEEWSVSVALDEALPLYMAAEAHWQSLKETRRLTNDYLMRAGELIDGLWGGSLDSEERFLILSELGQPPQFCLPIYLVAVGNGDDERVVYVGKTQSSTRFNGGHLVALKLHRPEYEGLKKTIYRCSVLLNIHNEYVALEWMAPEQLGDKILDQVESVLIHALQPEMNSVKRRKPTLGRAMFVHVQNFAETRLLNDFMLWHKDGEPLMFA